MNHALNDTFAFEFGALYAAKASNTAQLNSTKLGVGTNVNFQDLLGMDSWAWGPDVAARWRMSEKWRLEASYFWISQSGTKGITQDIQWGDVVYPVNTVVTSKLNFSDFRTSVGWSFYKTSDKELGIGLGLHVLSYQASLASTTLGTEGGNVLAPLPVVSFYGGFAMNEHWSVQARLDVFSLTYEQYHGSITSVGLDVLYQPFRHVGFGVGYRALRHRLPGRLYGPRLVPRKVQSDAAGSRDVRDPDLLKPCGPHYSGSISADILPVAKR